MRIHHVLAVVIAMAGLIVAPAGFRPAGQGAEAAFLSEVKKLLASDAEPSDVFGYAVAVSGDTVIVGASGEDAGGISDAGAAYVFQRDEGGADNWGEVKKLVASDAQAFDQFGSWSVALSGDTAVVGARLEDAGGILDAGAAYVFQRDQGGADNWGEVKKLTASDAQARDQFGQGVAVDGDTAVVGAWQGGAAGSQAGAAYVFQRDEGGTGNWGQVMRLTASDTEAGDHFGQSVAVSGGTAVVGAFWEAAGGTQAGAAYVFQRDAGGAGNWGEVKKLTASDTEGGDRFGYHVAVSSDTAVVGAYREGAEGSDIGAAYVFQRDEGGAGNWGEVKKLTASDAEGNDRFGFSVAVNGDTAVVGARLEDAGGISDTGAAYVFQRDEGGAGNWGEVKKLTASDAQASDRFGQSVAVSGETAVVGAGLEDSRGSQAGAAYVFVAGPAGGPTPTTTAIYTSTATRPPTSTNTPTPPVTPTATPSALLGDVSCDGVLDSIDPLLILQFVADFLQSLSCESDADVDLSGTIDSLDALIILQHIAGLIASLPP